MNDQTTETVQTNPMTDTASEMFTSILHQRLESGALEQAVSKQVDKLIESTVDDLFKPYGDVGKALKEKLAASIMPQLQSIDDLPTYQDFVMNRLKMATQNFYDNRLAEVVDAELKETLTELPENITLSWLVSQVVETASNDRDDEVEGGITLIIEDMFHFTNTSKRLCIGKEENMTRKDCEFNLHLSKDKESGKWEILSIDLDGKRSNNSLSVGRLYGFEKMLFNIYAMKGSIALDCGEDADDYETTWSRDY